MSPAATGGVGIAGSLVFVAIGDEALKGGNGLRKVAVHGVGEKLGTRSPCGYQREVLLGVLYRRIVCFLEFACVVAQMEIMLGLNDGMMHDTMNARRNPVKWPRWDCGSEPFVGTNRRVSCNRRSSRAERSSMGHRFFVHP